MTMTAETKMPQERMVTLKSIDDNGNQWIARSSLIHITYQYFILEPIFKRCVYTLRDRQPSKV